MRLGLSSIVGDSFGTGSFGIDGVSTPPSFPPAGTYYDTQYGVEYPVAEGGSYVQNPITSEIVPNQTCDVDREHDGSGGIVYDWTTATNVAFKPYGEVFYVHTGAVGGVPVEVPSGSGNYYDGGTTQDQAYRHDGSGYWFNTYYGTITWYSNGDTTNIDVLDVSTMVEVPTGSGNFYNSGEVVGYTWNGSGGYNYPVTKTAHYANGDDTNIDVLDANTMVEVPTGSGNFYHNGEVVGYTWNGSGGYNYPVIKTAQYGNGDDTNLSSLDVYGTMEVPTGSGYWVNTGDYEGYTWDGAGGYNYPVTKATRYPDGTVLLENITGSTGSVEVPTGSGNYYDSQNTGDLYTIKDPTYSPAYDYYTTWYKPNGEFIYYDGTYDYYWNGSGGYYT